MDLTIAIGTFGADSWADLACKRAVPSGKALGCPVVHVHANTLHDARNAALAEVKTDRVCFLDADDELDPGFIHAMSQGAADLLAPSVVYIRNGRRRPPWMPRVAGHVHDCTAACISSGAGNWLVIGTVAPASLLHSIGGFRDWPVYEDFDIWMRAILAGATVQAIPDAHYIAHVRRDSRNRAPSMQVKDRVHHDIVAANLPAVAA